MFTGQALKMNISSHRRCPLASKHLDQCLAKVEIPGCVYDDVDGAVDDEKEVAEGDHMFSPFRPLSISFIYSFIDIQDDSRRMTDKRDNNNREEKSSHGNISLVLSHLADGSEDKNVQSCQDNHRDQCHHYEVDDDTIV